MMPIDFEETNITLRRPSNMPEDKCFDIKEFIGVDTDEISFILTVWQPSKDDIDAFNAGRPLMLKVCGHQTPPVAMWTLDKKFLPNT